MSTLSKDKEELVDLDGGKEEIMEVVGCG